MRERERKRALLEVFMGNGLNSKNNQTVFLMLVVAFFNILVSSKTFADLEQISKVEFTRTRT